MSDEPDMNPQDFSVMGGGPFHELARRLGLLGASGMLRVFRLAILMWSPIALAAVLRMVIGWGPDPFVLDFSVHARFLISLPLLVVAGHLVDGSARAAVLQLYDSNFADRAELDQLMIRARKVRDSGWVEATFALLALIGGQATLWGLLGPTGVVHGVESAGHSVMRAYYSGLALPFLQFITLRWVWRWLVWSYVVVRIGLMPLQTIATHPDRAAGLSFMAGPVTGFAVFEMALASLLSAAWGTQLLDGRITVPSLLPTLLVFVVIASSLACLPLVAFTPHLYRAKRRSLLLYNPFTLEYMRRFQRKWIEHRSEMDAKVLGTADIQSMADIGNAYKVILDTRTFVFGKSKLVELWVAAAVPMVPLIVTVVPVSELLKRIGGALTGGLFG